MTDETIQSAEQSAGKRIERARSQDMDVSLVDTDPVVVQVYNQASDRIHTVIPGSVHCSCEDHTYRGIICKHLIELLQQEGHIGDVTREALREERDAVQVEQAELQEQLDALQERRDQISAALGALDISPVRSETVQDVADGVEAEAEAVEEAPEESPFEQMVQDLSGGQ